MNGSEENHVNRSNKAEEHQILSLKRASYALCIIGSLCAPFFLIYAQPDTSLGYIIAHFDDVIFGVLYSFMLGAVPYIALAALTKYSRSDTLTMIYFLITAGVVIYGYYGYIELFLIKKENGAGFLLVMMPFMQMIPVIVALLISFVGGFIGELSKDEKN